MTGGAEVRKAGDDSARQQAVAQNAAEAKASVRGMQMGIRDILLARLGLEGIDDERLLTVSEPACSRGECAGHMPRVRAVVDVLDRPSQRRSLGMAARLLETVEAFGIEMTNSSSELIDYFIKQQGARK